MNKTQAHWSKTCCHYREKDEMIYIIVTSIMCLLPLLFYILVKLFVDVKKSTLSQRKTNKYAKLLFLSLMVFFFSENRFAESVNTPSTSCRR